MSDEFHPGRRRSRSDDSDKESHLDFKPHPEDELGPPCPTCNGRGVVDKNEDAAIALIPVNDNRLKPRRTKLYVAIAVGTSFLICFLTAFFLYERSITLHIKQATVTAYNFDSNVTQGTVYIDLTLRVGVENENYFSLSTNNLTINIQGQRQVGSCSLQRAYSVSPRSTQELTCYATLNLTGASQQQIKHVCEPTSSWKHFMLIFSTTLNWRYLTIDNGMLQDTDWTCFTCRLHDLPNIGTKDSCIKNQTTSEFSSELHHNNLPSLQLSVSA